MWVADHVLQHDQQWLHLQGYELWRVCLNEGSYHQFFSAHRLRPLHFATLKVSDGWSEIILSTPWILLIHVRKAS